MKGISRFGLAFLVSVVFVTVVQAQSTEVNHNAYVDLEVDNIVIDTDGLISASDQLSGSIESLARSLDRLATDSDTFNADEKQQLIEAAASVSRASVAVENMAQQLPQSIQQLGQQLPQVIAASEKPINQISTSITTAAGGIQTVVDQLPQATENARVMALDVVNSVFWQMIKFGVLFIILTIAIIALSIWFFYRRWIQPMLQEYKVLSDAPRQFALMSEHMKLTSENLLSIRKLEQAVAEPTLNMPRESENEPDKKTPENS